MLRCCILKRVQWAFRAFACEVLSDARYARSSHISCESLIFLVVWLCHLELCALPFRSSICVHSEILQGCCAGMGGCYTSAHHLKPCPSQAG